MSRFGHGVEVLLRRLLKSSNDLLRSVVLHMWSVCGKAATLCYWGHMKEIGLIITRRQSAQWIFERDVFSLTSFRIHRLFQIISSYFTLTSVRQENREAADNGFLADDCIWKASLSVTVDSQSYQRYLLKDMKDSI